MIHPLRRQHRYTWILLAILLPLGFTLAVIAIPEQKLHSKNLGFGKTGALMDIEKSAAGTQLKANLRKDPKQLVRQIEIMVMHPLQSPSATVYLSPEASININGGQFLGQLGPKGVYRFNLDSVQSQYSEIHLLIYDPIKDQPIDQVRL